MHMFVCSHNSQLIHVDTCTHNKYYLLLNGNELIFSLSDTNSEFSAVSVIKVALIGMTAIIL